MAAQYELLKELLNSGTKLSFGQDFFFKFYQAFLLKDRWMQYINGVGTTLLVTALALALGVVLGSVVALVRVTHDQQRPGHKNAVLGFFNAVCQVYTTIIRGTPMMVQLLIMSMVIFSNSRNFTMVGALTLGINSGAYDVIILNFANCDMVGHTGVLEAAIKAVETVDTCVGKVVDATLKMGGIAMVTADHGNAEDMKQPDGSPMTAHTTNLVPFILCGAGTELRPGRLADIAPTILDVMGLACPEEMDGKTLIVK